MTTTNEILELTPKEIWKLINRSDREIRILGEDGLRHYARTSFWKTKGGEDAVTIDWTETDQECGCDLNHEDFFPVEVVRPNEEYIIWWCGNAVRFVFVQPSF